MSSGVRVSAGWKDAAAWDTAFAQADVFLPIVSESITKTPDMRRSQALVGQVAQHDPDFGIYGVVGDLTYELDYAAAALFEHVMGAVSSEVYTFTDDLDDYFHLEIDKITKRLRYASCIVNSCTISADAQAENPITVTLNVTARTMTQSDTAIGALTDPEKRSFHHHLAGSGYVRIGDTANALDSGDEISISGFEITIDNNIDTEGRDSETTDYALDPIRAGHRSVSCRLMFPRFTADGVTVRGFLDGDTAIQMSIYLYLDGTNTCLFNFPYGKVVEGANFNVGGPGIIAGEINTEWFYNGTKNSYMAVTDQMQITVV
jgi:hypothetical protein